MIRVENLTRDYGPVRALDSVSFTVGKNQVLGFLGPNGAGKSTAMKIITTYLAPTDGRVTVDGIDVVEDPIGVRRKIGYLPETNPLYVDMRVDEYLGFCARARGLTGPQLRTRLDYVVQAAGIGHVLKKNIQELSKGFKQRTGLAQALVHDPPVLVLDEPTSGLDPLQIVEIRKLVQELAKEKTIVFSTHILSEISSTTDRVIIINGGKIIADGHVSELTRQAVGEQVLEVVLKAPAAAVESRLGSVAGISRLAVDQDSGDTSTARLTVSGNPVSVQREVGELAASEGWAVLGLATKAATLEDVFLHLVREEVSHV
jgi:ABC-2 type transport system ATP-binding protein